MASLLVKLAAKKALEDRTKKNTNKEDPFYEYEEVEVVRKGKVETQWKKVGKKGIPPGVSPHDADVLKQVRRRAHHLDLSLFNLCGIKFGWSSVIGLIPAVGDLLDMFLALMLVQKCTKVEGGLPMMIKSRMLLNVMIDFAIGLVPFVGDIADAVYRANTRNAWLLELYLTNKAAELDKRGISTLADADLETNASSAGAPQKPQPTKQKNKARNPRTDLEPNIAGEGRS
ncbi:hypothetical protein RB594_000577 [Gaeumannomyces avenae]